MRTSTSQFELMVDMMESYGDLSKPEEGPNGRISNIKQWAELTELLNADGTGNQRTAEKWRKVWSDLKNNTKRKAARCYRAASETGEGTASEIKLSNLEQRVLNIIGSQAAMGVTVTAEMCGRISPEKNKKKIRIGMVDGPRRLHPATQSELARLQFLKSDNEWRKFQMERERQAAELEKERLRLKEVELQQQAKWQELFAQLLILVNKYIEK